MVFTWNFNFWYRYSNNLSVNNKKRGFIKFSLFGFLYLNLIFAILIMLLFNDIDNPFVFG